MPIQNEKPQNSKLEEKLKLVVTFQEHYNCPGLLTWLITNEKIVLSYLYNDENLDIDAMLGDLNTLFLMGDIDDFSYGPSFNYVITIPNEGCIFNYKIIFSIQKQL